MRYAIIPLFGPPCVGVSPDLVPGLLYLDDCMSVRVLGSYQCEW